MANKKKNANYVTEKTTAARNAKLSAERRAKNKKTIITVLAIVLAIAVVVGAVFAIGIPLGMLEYSPEATSHVSITVEGYDDTIHVELYGEDAPESVAKFMELVNGKYFNIRSFHTLSGGLLYFGSKTADAGDKGIKGEFADNGFENKISITKGTIVVARGEGYDSGAEQFFVATEDLSDLDGKYAAFARVTSGFEVIEDIIKNAEIDANGRIVNPPLIKSISSHDSH